MPSFLTWFDYCNSLCVGTDQLTPHHLQVIKTAAAPLLTGTKKG